MFIDPEHLDDRERIGYFKPHPELRICAPFPIRYEVCPKCLGTGIHLVRAWQYLYGSHPYAYTEEEDRAVNNPDNWQKCEWCSERRVIPVLDETAKDWPWGEEGRVLLQRQKALQEIMRRER